MLVLASLSSASAGEGLIVLCLATDGHVAVEPGTDQCAASEVGSQVQVADAGPVAGPSFTDCCGPCADVPLGSAAFLTRADSDHGAPRGHAVAIAGWNASLLLVPSSDARRAREPAGRRQDPPRASLLSLLRC